MLCEQKTRRTHIKILSGLISLENGSFSEKPFEACLRCELADEWIQDYEQLRWPGHIPPDKSVLHLQRKCRILWAWSSNPLPEETPLSSIDERCLEKNRRAEPPRESLILQARHVLLEHGLAKERGFRRMTLLSWGTRTWSFFSISSFFKSFMAYIFPVSTFWTNLTYGYDKCRASSELSK